VIPVLFTWFSEGGREVNWPTTMPFVPEVGAGIHVGRDDEPIRNVRRVLWVYDTGKQWHVEVTLA
jgi:hypothetical protein